MMNNMSLFTCKQILPSLTLNIPSGSGGLDMPVLRCLPPKEKVLVVMGATGTGKSRLAIDLADRFSAEIINSDKIQVYQGLDIATNKITPEESRGVPHHMIGIAEPNTEFTSADFCNTASSTMKSIVGRGQLPMMVGGSNSYIEALIDNDDCEFRSRYECCFLWVDVSMPVLHSSLSKRVDQMVQSGMVEEVRSIFNPINNNDYSRGIRKAIGVPEFDRFFRAEASLFVDKATQDKLLEEAINEIKLNNCKLACRQLEKIHRLKNVKKWKLQRLDATEVFRKSGKEAEETWQKLVVGPSTMIVNRFLYNNSSCSSSSSGGGGPRVCAEAAGPLRAAAAIGTAAAKHSPVGSPY